MSPEARPSILGRVMTRLVSQATIVFERSIAQRVETQTMRASTEINRKVIKAKERAGSLIRLDPQILELVGYSMIIVAAEQMEARKKHFGAYFDLMRDAARKSRAIFIARHFPDESLRQTMLDQNHDRQMAVKLVEWFYNGNPKVDIFRNMSREFIDSRRALEQLFRAGQNPIPPQR